MTISLFQIATCLGNCRCCPELVGEQGSNRNPDLAAGEKGKIVRSPYYSVFLCS